MSELKVHVLFRFSKKTGRVDTTMTGLGSAMMKLWALNNTTKTKDTIIIERDTGEVVYIASGNADFPKIKEGRLGLCDRFGIPSSVVAGMTDDRFDKEEVAR